jgi:hypothetical protein
MHYRELDIAVDGLLSLSLHGERFPQERYLNLDGKPLYLAGNVCETCFVIFRKLRNANLPLAPIQLSTLFETGLQSIPADIVETVKLLLPKGKYIVGLVRSNYWKAQKRQPGRYFPNCQADYYWMRHINPDEYLYRDEIILPVVEERRLNKRRIKFYKDRIIEGQVPTALAFSIVDSRVPRGGLYHQSTLVHFLLDGHHKVMAASQLEKPISILSFLLVMDQDQLYKVRLDDEVIAEQYGIK